MRAETEMTSEKKKRVGELEEKLSYLFSDNVTAEQKRKVLTDAYFQVWNSGYCDGMAIKLACGAEDEQTCLWEKNCEHKYEIDELLGLLKETEK